MPYLGVVIPWLSQNRGEFSFLIHPNTGCAHEDHTKWAFWVGEKWNLDTSIFKEGVKTNEEGHYAGDVGNPTCLSRGISCGSPDFFGPAMACCEGTICDCKNKFNCMCKSVKNNLQLLE